jgi:peptidyl-prolyl cis-trans isomerase A (cyclophilin A)
MPLGWTGPDPVRRYEGPQIRIETALGELTVEVAETAAPISSAYFLSGVRERIYDGTAFFRVVHPDDSPRAIAVVQGGMPPQVDSGFAPITHESTSTTGLRHRTGTISLARFGPGAVYHSFFICLRDEPELDFGGLRQPDGQGFAAFGRIVSGLGVAQRVFGESRGVELPADPVTIKTIRVILPRSARE